jgi:hypothetical protein
MRPARTSLVRGPRFTSMRLLPSLAISAFAAVAVSSPASAATVSPTHVRFPVVAVNAQGRTVVAWERLSHGRFTVEARIGSAATRLGRTITLAAKGYRPRVAVGSDGTVAVQWTQSGPGRDVRILVAIARRGHALGTPQVVEQRKGLVAPAGVAVQPNGRVVALWQSSSRRIAVALARPGHRFGTGRTLAATGPLTGGAMTIDPRDGTVVVPYGTPLGVGPSVNQQAAVVTLAPAAAAFSAPIVLSATGPGSGPFDEARPVAVSGPGGAAVAYNVSANPSSLSIARRGADGSWGSRELIETVPAIEDVFAEGLQATIAADGSAAAAWSVVQEVPSGLGGNLASQTVASIAGRAVGFGAPFALTPAGARFGFPSIAAAGDEVFVASAEEHGRVLLSTRAAGATSFGAPVRITSQGDGDALLAAGGSHVLLAYQQADRLHLKVIR